MVLVCHSQKRLAGLAWEYLPHFKCQANAQGLCIFLYSKVWIFLGNKLCLYSCISLTAVPWTKGSHMLQATGYHHSWPKRGEELSLLLPGRQDTGRTQQLPRWCPDFPSIPSKGKSKTAERMKRFKEWNPPVDGSSTFCQRSGGSI